MVKTKKKERDLDLKSQALQAKSQCRDQVAPETAMKTTLTEMHEAGYVINISNE